MTEDEYVDVGEVLTEEEIAQVQCYANRHGLSFAEAFIALIKRGLEAQ